MIDLRSDTVTRPTPGMLDAMMKAKVGDDVFGEDESVNALQSRLAEMFGMEAALFCPTGTMTNQIGIRVHTQPGDEVICDQLAHVYLNEGGGIAVNSNSSVRTLRGDHGRFTAAQVKENINRPDDPHPPRTRVVAVENTVNKGGGACWDLGEIQRIRDVCTEHGLAYHLDGARLFNALVARGESPREYGSRFDTISVCLSKGLGTPAGSVLLGTREHIRRGIRVRKLMGGGMRQAGYLAAAGLYALDHHVDRLKDDHRRAQALEKTLASLGYVSGVLPVRTNIVIFSLAEAVSPQRFLAFLKERSALAFAIGPQTIRMVFHLDISESHLDRLTEILREFRA